MKEIFYFIGILFIIYEFYYLLNLNKNVETTYRFLELREENKDRDWDFQDSEYKQIALFKGLPALLWLLWSFCGLLTFNWVSFLIFILIQFLIVSPLGRLTKYTLFYNLLMLINTILGILFGLFVLLNTYHFKIDLQPYFLELWNYLF